MEVTEEQKQKYKEYIKSPKWKRFKLSILKTRGEKCELCNEKTSFLDLHHIHYRTLYNEQPEDVLLLCRECHENQHPKKNPILKFADMLADSIDIELFEVKKTRALRNCPSCLLEVPIGSKGYTVTFIYRNNQSRSVCYDCGKLIDQDKTLRFKLPWDYGRRY